MNDRIRQLAKCNERIQNFFETGPVQRAAIEEFVELIVRECADLLPADMTHGPDSRPLLQVFKKHFGIDK